MGNHASSSNNRCPLLRGRRGIVRSACPVVCDHGVVSDGVLSDLDNRLCGTPANVARRHTVSKHVANVAHRAPGTAAQTRSLLDILQRRTQGQWPAMTAHTVAYNVAAGATREAEKTLQRSQATLDAVPQRHTLPRLADVAESLSRAGLAAAHAELCNAALQQLAQLAYQVDTDGRPANVDLDGRLLIPLPFGKSGYKKWQLRRRESDVLRAILQARQTPQPGRALPLFVYDSLSRAWYVNVQDYPSEAHAMAYIRQCPIASREYKAYLERAQEAGRRQAQARQRVSRR